jgi:hypothetical protein
MNRRKFLSATAATAAMIPLHKLMAGEPEVMKEYLAATSTGRKVLKQMENDYMKVIVNSDASMEITDKQNKHTWLAGPVAMQEEGTIDVGHHWLRTDRGSLEQYPGRFAGEKAGNYLQFKLIEAPLGRVTGSFVCDFTLEGDSMLFTLIQTDEKIPSLVFPPPIQAESLVLTNDNGTIINSALSKWSRKVYAHGNMVMRWFGGINKQMGYIAIFEQGWADTWLLHCFKTLAPAHVKSLGKWTKRTIRYKFTNEGYVGLAKIYREFALKNKIGRTLKEKIEDIPAMANVIGTKWLKGRTGRNPYASVENMEDSMEYPAKPVEIEVQQTFNDWRKITAEAKSMGFKKGFISVHGWMKGSFDGAHPDIWPPYEPLGSIDDLKKLIAENDEPYLFSLHENYSDAYAFSEGFPKGMCLDKYGNPLKGGIWGNRQCYIFNTRSVMEIVKRNWEQLSSIGLKHLYIDAYVTQLSESFEKGNTQTREEFANGKNEALKYLYDRKAVVCTEGATEIGMYYNGGGHTKVPSMKKTDSQGDYLVPLLQLVYHDCLNLNTGANPDNKNDKLYLYCLLYGHSLAMGPQFGGKERWEAFKKGTWQMSSLIDDWHAKTGLAEMTNHRIIDENKSVQECEFSSGHKIIINTGDTPYTHDGKTIGANDYLML